MRALIFRFRPIEQVYSSTAKPERGAQTRARAKAEPTGVSVYDRLVRASLPVLVHVEAHRYLLPKKQKSRDCSRPLQKTEYDL